MRAVSSDQKIRYAVMALTLAVLLPCLFIPEGYFRWVAVAVLIVATAVTLVLVKKRSILSFHKRHVTLLLAVVAAVYVMLLYLTGIIFGFYATLLPLSKSSVLTHVLPIALIIVVTELLRSILIDSKSRGVAVLLFVTCVVAELFTGRAISTINSTPMMMEFIGMTVFPAITSNILYHYISKRYGMYPNIAYRLILTLYSYFIPYKTAAPEIIPAFAGVLLPLAAMLFMQTLYEKKQKTAAKKKNKWRFAAFIGFLAVIISVVMLISCEFRYGILVIASPSMEDKLHVGDAVVFEDDEHRRPEKGDVIVFQTSEKTTIVHRVVEVERVGNELRYYTKGDANEDMDFGFVTDREIVGVVRFKIAYIGYPSLRLRDLFEN